MILINLRGDWREFLESDMLGYGLKYEQNESLEENTLTYLNARRRIADRGARIVHESKELRIPNGHYGDYSMLKKLMTEGGDLRPYLSQDITKNRADKNDGQLNSWGIQHLHFQSAKTKDVLFAKITDTEVFVIQSFSHGRGHSDVWVNKQLLQILHDNWPEQSTGKLTGIRPESLTTDAMQGLRKSNANFAVGMVDGIVYMAPGGGLTPSGRCISDVVDRDRIFSYLDQSQKQVEANEDSFRAALKILPTENLSIKMGFKDRESWLFEPSRGIKFFLQQNVEPSVR